MPPPSALSTQNSPSNPDRRSPKSVAAVSVSSVPSVGRTPVSTAPISLLSHLSSVPSTAAPRHSPLATRHFPITPFAEFAEAPKEKDHCFALLLLALGPLFAHSFFAKSFTCHSYENTRGIPPSRSSSRSYSPQGVPKWNSIHERTTCKPPCSHPTVPSAATLSPRAVTAAKLSPASVTAIASCTNVFTVPWF